MIVGVDFSAWENVLDFNKTKSAGASFCITRGLFGLMIDKKFREYWPKMKEAGLIRGLYGFLTWDSDPVVQATTLYEMVKNDLPEMPFIVDFEPYNRGNGDFSIPKDAPTRLKSYCDTLEKLDGRKPIIYTGAYIWQESGNTKSFWADYLLWIAAYQTSAPKIPLPWKNYFLWQYTEKGNGSQYGCDGGGIDMNRFEGTYDEFCKVIGYSNSSPIPDPIDPIPNEDDMLTYITLTEMNVRTGPNIKYPVVSTLAKGTSINPLDVSGDEVWVQISDNAWVCKSRKGNIYLEKEG